MNDASIPSLGDIPPETFREMGHRMIDWIAEHLEHPGRVPVMARTAPGAVRAAFPDRPPERPVALDAQWAQFQEAVLPGITHWNHPAFFAFFGITGSYPGILADLLASALNVNAMMWKMSPAATELEQVALDWLRQGLGLSERWFGMIQDTASTASLIAMTAARERIGAGIRERGLAGRADLPRLTAYCSDQTNYSVDKAAIAAGIGLENLRKLPVDEAYRLRPEALEEAIAEDRRAGRLPFFVCATVGTTSTTSIDPLPAIAAICRREKLWLHVDGAYGGMAALCPELRRVLDGIEGADSLVVNPHKWLFTPMDTSAFYTRDPETLRRAFTLQPVYVKSAVTEDTINFTDYSVPLGRRFRGLKLWMVLSTYGLEGLRARIREHIRLGQWLAAQIDAHPDFERLAPVPFSTVCFRHVPRALAGRKDDPSTAQEIDSVNQRLMNRLNDSGKLFMSNTVLGGRFALRLAIGNIRSDERAVREAWGEIAGEAKRQ